MQYLLGTRFDRKEKQNVKKLYGRTLDSMIINPTQNDGNSNNNNRMNTRQNDDDDIGGDEDGTNIEDVLTQEVQEEADILNHDTANEDGKNQEEE